MANAVTDAVVVVRTKVVMVATSIVIIDKVAVAGIDTIVFVAVAVVAAGSESCFGSVRAAIAAAAR